MITTLVKEKSNRVLLKASEFSGFSEVYMFEKNIDYLICNICFCCIKVNAKMVNYIDAHKSSCEGYPKKSTTLDVHKLCFRKLFYMIYHYRYIRCVFNYKTKSLRRRFLSICHKFSVIKHPISLRNVIGCLIFQL